MPPEIEDGYQKTAILEAGVNSSKASFCCLKLTAKAPENGWLEDDRFFFQVSGAMLVSGGVSMLVLGGCNLGQEWWHVEE